MCKKYMMRGAFGTQRKRNKQSVFFNLIDFVENGIEVAMEMPQGRNPADCSGRE